MGLQTISVKEAVNKINASTNGWFLPAVQRPYVWGSRYESEKYICKLFDSILNSYPIGTLIVWNTEKKVPYREFMTDYEDGKIAVLVDNDLWSRKDKWLVYDGQQRLQTLYSCLKYTLNKRILAYNLLYDSKNADEDYGFKFIDKNSNEPGYIKLPVLFSKLEDEKVDYRKQIKDSLTDLSSDKESLFEKRYDKLWSVFVGTDTKSLAYFSIDNSWDEDKVNDVFQRLNTGGVPLSGADLLFSTIKETKPDFEETLVEVSRWISEVTNGYAFSSNEILQLINLIVKGTTRIDATKVKKNEIDEFINIGESIGEPLKDFFGEFFKAFNINNNAIVSKKLAVLPLIVFSYINFKNETGYLKLSADNVAKMKQYFILSQLNDWNTQGIVEGSTRKIIGDEKPLGTRVITASDFPLEDIKKVAREKNRVISLESETIECNLWFSLKIMTPNREFINQKSVSGRYKPELDHIFPLKLENKPDDYEVDIIWNLQPVEGRTNLLKSNVHPYTFFSNVDTMGHISEYDFMPADLSSDEWNDHKKFIDERKKRMIAFMNKKYNIDIATT